VKTLVVYYSRTGNTRLIGNEIAAALGADVEELKDKKNRKGPIGFLMAGREAMKGLPTELEALDHDPAAYDLVLVGSPVWAGSLCPPVRTFLTQQHADLKQVAWFSTCGSEDGSSASKAFSQMTEVSGRPPECTLALGPKAIKADHAEALAAFLGKINRQCPAK
jgi:flavodoxin